MPPSLTPTLITDMSGIILAGGDSRRMGGVNKALLEVGGRRIVERVAEVLRTVFSRVLAITNTPDQFAFLDLPMYKDILPGRGSLGGLYTGLSVCRSRYVFLVACDMPFLNPAVIRHIVNAGQGADIVIPRIGGKLQPLHAMYSLRCIPFIEELLQRNDLKIINFFQKVIVREISEDQLLVFDPALRFIMNLNTPQDLAQARKIADAITCE